MLWHYNFYQSSLETMHWQFWRFQVQEYWFVLDWLGSCIFHLVKDKKDIPIIMGRVFGLLCRNPASQTIVTPARYVLDVQSCSKLHFERDRLLCKLIQAQWIILFFHGVFAYNYYYHMPHVLELWDIIWCWIICLDSYLIYLHSLQTRSRSYNFLYITREWFSLWLVFFWHIH